MQSTTPEVDAPLLEIAKNQAGFLPVVGALVHHPGYGDEKPNTILLAFRPSPVERAAIAGGADVYVSQLTFGGPMHGTIVTAGKEEASRVYNVRVAPRLEPYRGYSADVWFDATVGLYHGDVAGIRDVVTFQADREDELARAFRASVDDYLAMCAERGEQPNSPAGGTPA